MNPGLLNKRITFVNQSETQDSYGDTTDFLTEVKTVWANIKPLQGRELFLAQQVHSQITTKVTVRYQTDITPNMKIRYNNRVLEITSVINVDEQNRFLELICKETV